MNKQNKDRHIQDTLPRPSWDGVRPIYRKLSDEFSVLTDAYQIEINDKIKEQLDHLIVSIDDVDQSIDDLHEKSERDAITASLLAYLDDDQLEWKYTNAPTSFLKKIENLKHVVLARSIKEEFIQASREIFDVTERKRHTQNQDELIAYIEQEGRATARLPLSFLGIGVEEKFGMFFTKLCMIMGIADLIFDARQDYKDGLIKVKPGLGLYLTLIKIVMIQGFKMIFDFPQKLKFLVYCFKFARELMK